MHDTSVTQRMHSHAAGHSYAVSTSHHRAVVELTRPRIVDDVSDQHLERKIHLVVCFLLAVDFSLMIDLVDRNHRIDL